MKDFLVYGLAINLLIKGVELFRALQGYFSENLNTLFFTNGTILGLWNSIVYFFMPLLQVVVAFSLIYIFMELSSVKESLIYLNKSKLD